jgi:ADP-ribose pyrophosphatase YjhB (NUDIX family)
MIKKAMFIEGHVPKGGTCLSSFLVMRGKGGILVGKMAKPELWVEKFLVGESYAPEAVRSGKWVLPASHLQFGESPEDAAARILTEEVQAKKAKLRLLQVQSYLSEDPNDPEAAHWDICFVHGGTFKGNLERPEWFSELKFVNTRNLNSGDFARGHGDILKQLGIIKR